MVVWEIMTLNNSTCIVSFKRAKNLDNLLLATFVYFSSITNVFEEMSGRKQIQIEDRMKMLEIY